MKKELEIAEVMMKRGFVSCDIRASNLSEFAVSLENKVAEKLKSRDLNRRIIPPMLVEYLKLKYEDYYTWTCDYIVDREDGQSDIESVEWALDLKTLDVGVYDKIITEAGEGLKVFKCIPLSDNAYGSLLDQLDAEVRYLAIDLDLDRY